MESSGVRRGDVGKYFAKQNAHSGAKPPQRRAGSSLQERIALQWLRVFELILLVVETYWEYLFDGIERSSEGGCG